MTKTMKGQRLKRLAETAPVPANLADAAASVARIGELQRLLALHGAALSESAAQLKAAAEAAAAPLKAEIEDLTRGVQVYAEANREVLTGGGRVKTVALATGEIAWRARPPSVRIRDQGAVIETLQKLQLGRFLREKVEIDKEAMLKNPSLAETVPGVTIASAGEEFVVTPHAVELDGRAGL